MTWEQTALQRLDNDDPEALPGAVDTLRGDRGGVRLTSGGARRSSAVERASPADELGAVST